MDILKLYKEECCSKIQEIRKRCVCRLKYLNVHGMIICNNLSLFENPYL